MTLPKIISDSWINEIVLSSENAYTIVDGTAEIAYWGDGDAREDQKIIYAGGSETVKYALQMSSVTRTFAAVLTDRTVITIGRNSHGLLGRGIEDLTVVASHNSAGRVQNQLANTDLTNIKEVFAGHSHFCALDNNGKVYCWGANGRGQLGLGFEGGDFIAAREAVELNKYGKVIDVQISHTTTCVLIEDNRSVYCIGGNSAGRMGNTNAGSDESVAFPVMNL